MNIRVCDLCGSPDVAEHFKIKQFKLIGYTADFGELFPNFGWKRIDVCDKCMEIFRKNGRNKKQLFMKKNKEKEYAQQICPICQTGKDSLTEYPELCPHISSLELTHARPSCPYFKPINPNPNYKPPAFKNGDVDLKKS